MKNFIGIIIILLVLIIIGFGVYQTFKKTTPSVDVYNDIEGE